MILDNANNINMATLLLAAILFGVILAAARLLFRYWLQPSRLIRWYKATLEGLGYKVIALPYHPFKEPLPAIHRHSQQEHKDAFHEEKHSWPGQDIVLTNTGSIVTIILLKPRLLQSFYSEDKQPLFLKASHRRRDFNLLLKDSQLAKEDDNWKRKRKLFRDILNLDFIKSKVPELIKIAARNIQQLEQHT